jgi:PhnB protein
MSDKVKPVPEGYHTVTPALTVQGTPKLIDFLKQAFDAKEIEVMKRPDGAIAHAEVRIGDSVVMLGEANAELKPTPGSFYLYVTDADATYKRAIRAGATSIRELRDEFYGDRNGAVRDPFGNSWWIGTRKENLSREELQRRAEAQWKQQR